MRVKSHTTAEYFSFPVDVWALGITLLELLIERRITSDLGAEQHQPELEAYFRPSRVADADFVPFWALARRMVAWDASRRVTAAIVEKELEERLVEEGGTEELTPTPTKRQKHR